MSALSDRLKESAKFGSEIMEPIPGLKVEIRELSSGKRTKFGTAASRAAKDKTSKDPYGPLYRQLLGETAYDPETGQPVWDDKTIAQLDELPGTLVEKMGEVAFRVNGLTKGARADAKNGSEPDDESSS